MTTEEVKKIDTELLELYEIYKTGNALNDVRNILIDKWSNIRNNEEILSIALKQKNNTSFIAPNIASLILLDHENTDPLAYDVIAHAIYTNRHIARNENTFLPKNYEYNYLISTLFNKELTLTADMKKFILQTIFANELSRKRCNYNLYWIYTHPSFTEEELKRYTSYEFSCLLENYEERAKLRALTRLPF